MRLSRLQGRAPTVVDCQQELRHALIPGPARDLLARLAESLFFLYATTRSVSPSRMAERELCLRFLAFWLTPPERYVTRVIA